MKLNCAEFYSKEPTEEMIVDLVRNNAKRGEFMILEADDGEAFVQPIREEMHKWHLIRHP